MSFGINGKNYRWFKKHYFFGNNSYNQMLFSNALVSKDISFKNFIKSFW